MSERNIVRLASILVALIAFYMFYLVGSWMLCVAAFLYGWSLNMDNTVKEMDQSEPVKTHSKNPD